MSVVDQTPLFRACAKMVQARAKLEPVDDLERHSQQQRQTYRKDPRRPEPISKKYLSYVSKAAEIRQDITELRDVVVSRRRDYISAVGHFREIPVTSGMNDWERNQMDAEVDEAMRQCAKLIHTFQKQVREDQTLREDDEALHFRHVGNLLDKYLKKIAEIVSELRAVRLMKVQNMKKLSRLSTLVKRKESSDAVPYSPSLKSDSERSSETSSYQLTADSTTSTELRKRNTVKKEINPTDVPSQETSDEVVSKECSKNIAKYDTDNQQSEPIDEELEKQLLMENERLYAKIMHTDSDIQKVEKQLNEIYRLQQSFAEKVLEQGKDIEYVNQETVTTVENICDGNEQIRGAIQNMASRRVILLFCLIALTFTLLFLDWYNP